MNTKLLEVRDRDTLITVMATKMVPHDHAKKATERTFLRFAGYEEDASVVLVTKLANPSETHIDPYGWAFGRTMREAHMYIMECFDELSTGDVVDVEYILGETDQRKESQILKRG